MSEQAAMDRWVAVFNTRDEMATAYARLLKRKPATWGGWATLDLAIIDRWSAAALIYIKQRAWKLAESG